MLTRSEISRKGWDKRGRKHMLSEHPLYNTWSNILRRCYRENDASYADYGGRGIKVCEGWRYQPTRFIEYALSIGWRKGYSIDRIDNNGNYEPSNIRIATAAIQTSNTRRNKRFSFEGKKLLLKEWADETGIGYSCLEARIRRGWSIKRALTNPARSRRLLGAWNAANKGGQGISPGTMPPASRPAAPAK